MFKAVHESTGIIWNAFDILNTFPAPNKEKWICCLQHKNPVSFIKRHQRKESWVVAHFRSLTNHFCPGESDEHWQLKVDIKIGIQKKRYNLKFRGKEIQYPFNFIDNEIQIENRRADILLKFLEFNSFFGYGIVFEVAVSEKEESLLSKSKDWIKHKYSVAWIYTSPENNEIEIKFPYGLYEPNIKWCGSLYWNNKKFKTNQRINKKIERGDFSWLE